MLSRIAFPAVALMMTVGVPIASAQDEPRIEVSGNIGYSVSEGVDVENRPLLIGVFDKLTVDSGLSWNFTVGYLFTPHAEVEFLFGRQSSELFSEGPAGQLAISELNVYSYMANFVYNFGESDSRIRPYAYGGLGATHYAFGDLLLPPPVIAFRPGTKLDSETRFASNWGGGVKFYLTPRLGAKFGIRWTPTYIKSDPAGTWCDPFYGCWVLGDSDYSNQFETAGGITLRF